MDRHDQLANESLLEFYYRSIGPTDSMMLLLLAAVSFGLVAWVVLKGKGPTVGPALVLLAPVAAYYGLFSTFNGLLAVTRVIEQSGTNPDPNSLVSGFGSAISSFYAGMMLSIPTFLFAAIGAVARAVGLQDVK